MTPFPSIQIFGALRTRVPKDAAGAGRSLRQGVLQAHDGEEFVQHGSGRLGRACGGLPRSRAGAQARHGEGPRVQREPETAWLGIAAYGGADRQRRHAVPGRLGDDGAGRTGHRRARARASGGEVPARQGRQAGGGGRGHARVADPPGDRSPGRRSDGGDHRCHPEAAGRRARDRRRLERDAREDACRSPTTWRRAGCRSSDAGRRSAGIPALGRRRPLHLPRLSRIRGRRSRAATKCCARSKHPGWACCAARTRASRAR